jgi:hypothetical protein
MAAVDQFVVQPVGNVGGLVGQQTVDFTKVGSHVADEFVRVS